MIKRLSKADLDILHERLNDDGRVVKSVDKINKFLSNENNYFLAYLENGKIVGYLLAYTL